MQSTHWLEAGTARRGDRVQVEGFGGRTGVLRVWNCFDHGLGLCSEDGYQRLEAGRQAPVVGFPRADVRGVV
jgi:hypothetical protein